MELISGFRKEGSDVGKSYRRLGEEKLTAGASRSDPESTIKRKGEIKGIFRGGPITEPWEKDRVRDISREILFSKRF